MLHNAIETLLTVCDRRVSERVESVINTINKDANAHKVTWRIQPCGIERPNVDAHDVGVLYMERVFSNSLYNLTPTIMLNGIFGVAAAAEDTLVGGAAPFLGTPMRAPTIK